MTNQTGQPIFSLGEHWSSRMAQKHPTEYQKPLTHKERGQLKMLANKVGAQTKKLIDFAVNHWNRFGQEASVQAGLGDYPSRPQIGFFLAYHHVAVNMMQSIAPTPTTLPPAPQPEPEANDKAVQLALENQQSIQEMLARFAAAGEPCPAPTYNQMGEVLYKATKKEIAEIIFGRPQEELKPTLHKPSETEIVAGRG